VMVTEGGYEFEVFYYPHNHDWDVSYCEFTDGHDGPYVSGRRIRFHHNWVDNMQDDGIYLSSPTPYISDDVHVYQNLVTRAASALALHSRGGPDGNIYVYRNIIDLRRGVHRQRPTPENPAGEVTTYQIFLMHGREFLGVESIYLYQNTFLSPSRPSDYALRTLTNTGPRTRRVSLNNIFVYLSNPPTFEASFVRTGLAETAHDIRIDGNLHWCMDGEVPTDLLPAVRACPASRRGEEKDRSVWEASSFVADPGFRAMRREAAAENDYRLLSNSRAIGSGTILPDELEDPLRPAAGSKPDIGALPADGPPFAVGRWGRVRFPIAGAPEPRSAGPAAGS